MEKEETIKNAAEYKRKQNSYQRGLDSINSQIEDKNIELIKSLKKRPLPEDIGSVLEVEKKRSIKFEITESFRNSISNAKDGVEIAKDGEDQGGEIHPVFQFKD